MAMAQEHEGSVFLGLFWSLLITVLFGLAGYGAIWLINHLIMGVIK